MELVEGFRQYYIIDLPGEKLTVHVPSKMVDELGVRPVVPEGRVDNVLDTLGGTPALLPDDYKDRQCGVREQLATGMTMPIAEAIRDLIGHERRAHLTKVDRDLLAEGREFLAEELALVRDTDVLGALQLIDDALEPIIVEDNAN
jgi:RNA polymerase-interacting CarD/CdnL/TRCF family regulator